MSRKLITLLVRHRLVCVCLSLLVLGGGYLAMRHIPLDSFPNMTPVRVEVDTEVDGMAAEDVEKLITYPIEQALQGIPNVDTVRSTSKFSLSVVEVLFKSGTNLYWAREQVFQDLANADLPQGVTPSMAPMDEGTGQVFIYAITSHNLNSLQLRILQDFLFKPQLRVVPGIADVPMFGGFVQQYQVNLDPVKLTSFGLGIDDVVNAIQQNNQNSGGNFLVRGSTQYVIRGIGLVRTLSDIANVVVGSPNGIPIRIKDLAQVRIGPEVRQGAVSRNGQGEIVSAIVIKRIGENTYDAIHRVKQKLAEIQKSLSSPGARIFGMKTSDVRVETIYDQSYLIEQSIKTVKTSLIAGAVLIVFILLFLVGSFGASVIPILAMIFCIMVSVFLMDKYGITANLLSLGGLALSLGMMVDATVMITENVYRHVMEEQHEGLSHMEVIVEGAAEIFRPTFFAILVVIAVFLPVLVLKGIEGQLFIPLALAVVFSMVGSFFMAVALAPALCYWLIPEKKEARPNLVLRTLHNLYRIPVSISTSLMRFFHALYEAPLRISVQYPSIVIGISAAIVYLSFITLKLTGSEFLPPLEEGNFRLRIAFPPSISLPYALEVNKRIEKTILQILPEATQAVSYVGRPELGGDPESLSNDEVSIQLKPISQWPRGVTKEKLTDRLREGLSGIPGTNMDFSQELEMRTDEMISGFETPIAIYLMGTDAKTMIGLAESIKKILKKTPGAIDTGVEHITGVDSLNITPDRSRMQRYGVSTNNVMDVVNGAIGGTKAGEVFLQNQRYAIQVRTQPQYRTSMNTIRRLLVTSSSGLKIPLEDVADINFAKGFDHIDRWNGNRRIVITADVEAGYSVGSVVAEARKMVNQEIAPELQPGYSIYWAGEEGEAREAFTSLSYAILAVLIIVFILIHFCFDNIKDTLIVITSVPLGIAGGTFLLWLLHLHFNVPAYIGFIAKFGIAVQNGMIMVAYMNLLRRKGLSASEAAVKGGLVRLRPELLSALIGSLGLLPFLVASGTGATVERPLAAVVIGGVLVSRPMAWFLIPSLYALFKKGEPKKFLKTH